MTTPPSPWSGAHQVVWDSTSLDTYMTCPRQHHYAMRLGRRGTSESIHLTFGSALHHGIEAVVRAVHAGEEPTTALRLGLRAALTIAAHLPGPSSTGAVKSRLGLLRALVVWFDAGVWRRLDAVEVPWLRVRGPWTLVGRMDALAGTEPYEWKTTTSGHGPRLRAQFEARVQLRNYKWAAGAARITVGAFSLLVNSAEYREYPFYRTAWEETEWLQVLDATLTAAARDADAFAASGTVPRPNYTSCDKYGGCPFRRVCFAAPAVRQAILETDYVVARWNPLTASVEGDSISFDSK